MTGRRLLWVVDSRGAGMAICGGVRPCAACGRVLIKVSERPSAGWGGSALGWPRRARSGRRACSRGRRASLKWALLTRGVRGPGTRWLASGGGARRRELCSPNGPAGFQQHGSLGQSPRLGPQSQHSSSCSQEPRRWVGRELSSIGVVFRTLV